MAMTSFQWECIGGRCKLVEEPISLLKDDIIASERFKQMKHARMAFESSQLRKLQRQREEQEQQKLANYLKKHNFSDVNAVETITKASCLGFCRSSHYQRPLHKAAQDKDAEIIILLVKYGADPSYKDSKGKTAYDYLPPQAWRLHVQKGLKAAAHPEQMPSFEQIC